MKVFFWEVPHHQLQQLLLGALVQVGPLDCHQLAGGDVARHVDQTQVVEAPPCEREGSLKRTTLLL